MDIPIDPRLDSSYTSTSPQAATKIPTIIVNPTVGSQATPHYSAVPEPAMLTTPDSSLPNASLLSAPPRIQNHPASVNTTMPCPAVYRQRHNQQFMVLQPIPLEAPHHQYTGRASQSQCQPYSAHGSELQQAVSSNPTQRSTGAHQDHGPNFRLPQAAECVLTFNGYPLQNLPHWNSDASLWCQYHDASNGTTTRPIDALQAALHFAGLNPRYGNKSSRRRELQESNMENGKATKRVRFS